MRETRQHFTYHLSAIVRNSDSVVIGKNSRDRIPIEERNKLGRAATAGPMVRRGGPDFTVLTHKHRLG
jgi:hypothetical protein